MPPRRLERRPFAESLVERVDQQRPGEISGDTVPTGFPSLDRILGGGVRRRDLVVLGGDVGSGKSALALGIALRVAQQEGGVGVAFFSGEMDEERLMERALAVEGRDRKSTRLNSSHGYISYAVFCLKKKIEAMSLVVIECRSRGDRVRHN